MEISLEYISDLARYHRSGVCGLQDIWEISFTIKIGVPCFIVLGVVGH